MQGVPWWGVVSSVAAPVLMVGGWTAAADLQPRSGQTGLAERFAGAAQALWPLTAVLSREVAPGRAWRILAD
jgi:hypothetical protein